MTDDPVATPAPGTTPRHLAPGDVGLVAPRIFSSYFELGLGFVLTAVLAAIALRKTPILVWLSAVALAGVCGYFWTQQGYEFALLWMLLAIAIFFRGGGELSVDRLFKKEL